MKLVTFRTEHQAVTAIMGEPGRIYTPMVWIDSPVRLAKIPNGDARRFSREQDGKKPTLKQAARTILRNGKKLGITKAAQSFLRGV